MRAITLGATLCIAAAYTATQDESKVGSVMQADYWKGFAKQFKDLKCDKLQKLIPSPIVTWHHGVGFCNCNKANRKKCNTANRKCWDIGDEDECKDQSVCEWTSSYDPAVGYSAPPEDYDPPPTLASVGACPTWAAPSSSAPELCKFAQQEYPPNEWSYKNRDTTVGLSPLYLLEFCSLIAKKVCTNTANANSGASVCDCTPFIYGKNECESEDRKCSAVEGETGCNNQRVCTWKQACTVGGVNYRYDVQRLKTVVEESRDPD